MIRLPIDPRRPDPEALARAVKAIADGGVVALPTDTLYGLAVDPRQPAAVEALFRIKSRDAGQPVPVIAASESQVEECVGRLPELARRLARRHWPGPLTLVVEGAPDLAAALHSTDGRVAVRVPANRIALEVAQRVGYVVTATSANPSGREAPSTAEAVIELLGDSVDLVLDGGPAPGGPPSTVVDATGLAPVLLRAGAVAWERVLESLHEP